jgi:hypothetical protein
MKGDGMMENEIMEHWNKIYQCLSKPAAEFAELNMSTINNWSKHKGQLEELTQARKMGDILVTQMKLFNAGQLEAISYAVKAGDVWINILEQVNQLYDDMAKDAAEKSTGIIRAKSKRKE